MMTLSTPMISVMLICRAKMVGDKENPWNHLRAKGPWNEDLRITFRIPSSVSWISESMAFNPDVLLTKVIRLGYVAKSRVGIAQRKRHLEQMRA